MPVWVLAPFQWRSALHLRFRSSPFGPFGSIGVLVLVGRSVCVAVLCVLCVLSLFCFPAWSTCSCCCFGVVLAYLRLFSGALLCSCTLGASLLDRLAPLVCLFWLGVLCVLWFCVCCGCCVCSAYLPKAPALAAALGWLCCFSAGLLCAPAWPVHAPGLFELSPASVLNLVLLGLLLSPTSALG